MSTESETVNSKQQTVFALRAQLSGRMPALAPGYLKSRLQREGDFHALDPGMARETRLPLATLCHAFSVKTPSLTVGLLPRNCLLPTAAPTAPG